ncbi:MAG: uracil phosphoribosyltransferase [Chloroflexi bacterium]|nr:uracil phosphoribosyltransferase [Chloroflexota bacterium]
MSTVHVSNHPLLLHKLAILRNKATDPKRFRELIREISILLAYEATADLALAETAITTPLMPMQGKQLKEMIGLVPVLRAGLGMVEGIWEMMPAAEVWHIGLYRDHATLEPIKYYSKLPVAPTVDVCLILDPMLATGGTAVAAADLLKKWGARKIKYIGLIAAPEGIAKLQAAHPDVPIHVAAIDDRLTGADDPFPPGYILPGLGDAGDRQFGTG